MKADSAAADESLAIDMPQYGRDLLSSPTEAGPSRHPTARTISCDMDNDMFSRSRKQNAGDTRPKSSKYFRGRSLGAEDEDVFRPEPQASARSHSAILVDPSSSPPIPAQSLPSTARPTVVSKRTNPFSTTKEESEKRKVLKVAPKDSSIVDMTEDTPERLPLAQTSKSNNSAAGPNYRAANAEALKPKAKSGQISIVDFVGLADARGRPTKGTVAGAKVRRRA